MKIQIRKSVFETNSSSMHSLVVSKENGYYTEEELREGLYLFEEGEWDLSWGKDEICFGRFPFNCLCTFESKTRYAIASICRNEEDFEEIRKIFMKYIPECKSIRLPGKDNDNYRYGYVDEDILSGFLKKNNITLEEFLTNKKYVVIVDGDEYLIWNSLKESGLINLNKIEKEYNYRGDLYENAN